MENGNLPFLDLKPSLKLSRNVYRIEFSIYFKSMVTDRFITCDLYHPKQNNLVDFHSMGIPIKNISFSKKHYDEEKAKVKEIASIHGFDLKIIDKLINQC